ncbi:NAD-dependent epimerase/dehydratase family protein [Pseudonocardia humida]|uniref:NAD-dependent epimerase/dehydratase family protein n=1 Tax=Pseudonocardia humida TaxID=2800819 RepID=A0ABT0ZYG4_9PSEU|nr:NAD-dependent epimerase/dehydratase family protein [Pseudonocardia humida]MCO1655751.1 NAD-dependent epimerase/dehydratase family protein [Pseudonocardia humida]
MRIVITGASGNVGTALLDRLADGDDHEVVGVCRRPPAPAAPYDVASWVALDLAGPDASLALRPVLRGADAVVHLAWGFQPSHDTDYLDRTGVEGTRAVLNAAEAEGVPHLVHMSSAGAYSPGPDDPGPDATRVTEAWPTDGIDSLAYSTEKVAAERLLDDHERSHPDGVAVARLRPGLIVQRRAASALLRYGLPAYLPAALLGYVPLLPLDRGLSIPLVHASDVADAIVRVLERRATGAFNLAADPPVTRDLIADVLGAPAVHVPRGVLRAATALGWRTHLQPLAPGWIDLAFAVPLLDTGRARRELGWDPAIDSRTALAEVLAGMAEAAWAPSPPLRRRSVHRELASLVRHGPVTERSRP